MLYKIEYYLTQSTYVLYNNNVYITQNDCKIELLTSFIKLQRNAHNDNFVLGYVEKDTSGTSNGGLVLLQYENGDNIEIHKEDNLPFQVKVNENLLCSYIGEGDHSILELISLGKCQDIQDEEQINVNDLILFDLNRLQWFKASNIYIFDNYWLTTGIYCNVMILDELRLNHVSGNDYEDVLSEEALNYLSIGERIDYDASSFEDGDYDEYRDVYSEGERFEEEVTEEPEITQPSIISDNSDGRKFTRSENFKNKEITTEPRRMQPLNISNNSDVRKVENKKITTEPRITQPSSIPKISEKIKEQPKTTTEPVLSSNNSSNNSRNIKTTGNKETDEERYKRNIRGFKIYMGFVGLSVIFGFLAGRFYKRYLKRLAEENQRSVI